MSGQRSASVLADRYFLQTAGWPADIELPFAPAMEAIRTAFRNYFDGDVELPADLRPEGAELSGGGWMVRYVPGVDERGQPYLDFLAEHRMTNPRHLRLHADGRREYLECYRESYAYDEDVPGDEAQARAEYRAHNRRVHALLVGKGLADPDPFEDDEDEEPDPDDAPDPAPPAAPPLPARGLWAWLRRWWQR
jgi:hypothetical protein